MKKWMKIIPALLAGSLFLGGCSADSKVQVVTPKEKKERSLSVAESEDSLSEQVQAPERYQCDSTKNSIHILANARVLVPDVDGIKLKKVRSRNFTEKDMEQIQEALFQGEEIFASIELAVEEKAAEEKAAEEIVETEPAYDWEENEASSGTTDAIWDEQELLDNYIEIEQALKEMLKGERSFAGYEIEEMGYWCREAGYAAEDEKLRHRLWTMAALCEELSWNGGLTTWKEVTAADLVTVQEDYIDGLIFLPQKIGIFGLQNMSGGMNWISFEYGQALVEIVETNIQEAKELYGVQDSSETTSLLTNEEIRSASDELMQKLGDGTLELAEIEERALQYYYFMADGYSHTEPGVCFVYNRVIDGVPMNYTGQYDSYAIAEEGALVQWPSEQIRAVYGEDGLVNFQWSSPVEVEDWQDEYAFLLPFSEIRDIFEEMTFNDYTGKRRDYPGIWTVNIQEVRLGYVQVADKDAYQTETNIVETENGEAYTGILVPAWDFIGTAEGEMAEWLGVESGSRISFMTINAMDGSIIEKY